MTEQQKTTGQRPTHRAFVVKTIPNSDKSRWIEIGAGWEHKDDKGFRVKLDAYPSYGEPIELRLIDWEKIDEGKQESTPEDAPDQY